MNRHQASIPSRPRLLPCLALILAGSLLCGPAHAATYWYEDYLKAVRLIDKGQVNEARPFLEKAISKKPLSHHAQRIVGNDFIDYLPYLHRARISMESGNFEAAILDLEIEETIGEIQKTRDGSVRLKEMKGQITALQRPQASYVVPTGTDE